MAAGSGSLESLRELNRLRVVDALRRHGTLSRADIARLTGLSRSTISTLVADLQARGFIVERPDERAAAPPPRAARPSCCASTRSAGIAVGVDFDHDHVRVAVSDLVAHGPRRGAARTSTSTTTPAQALDLAADLVRDALDDAGRRPRPRARRRRRASPARSTSAHGAPPRLLDPRRLAGRRHRPPSCATASASRSTSTTTPTSARSPRSRSAPGATRGHAVYVQMSSGIGAGLIVDGRPYRGAAGVAGEIGHVAVDETGAICRCGNRGCLETVASGPGDRAPASPRAAARS